MIHVTERRPRRPDAEAVKRLGRLPAAVVADALSAVKAVHDLRQLGPARPHVAGVALTAQLVPGDNLALHKAIDMAEPGDVIVADAGGFVGRAVLGEIVARYAVARGLGAIVVDGAVRDADALADLSMPVWCRGTSPLRPNRSGPGAVGMPVSVGGCAVSTGDVVVGDADGIVFVPAAAARGVAESGQAILRDDEARGKAADCLELDRSWVDQMPVRRVPLP